LELGILGSKLKDEAGLPQHNYMQLMYLGLSSFYITMGTDSFAGVRQQWGHGIHYPPPPSTEVKERVEIYFYFPSGPS